MTGQTATHNVSKIELVQAVAGCVQLSASNDSNSTLWLNALEKQLRQQQGVLTLLTDATTGNLIIVFDPDVLPLSQMLEILQKWGVSGACDRSGTPMQVASFLQQHHEIESLAPMIAGMLVTQTLRLRGGWALLANLMAATLTRQAIEGLEKTSGFGPPTAPSEPAPTPIVEKAVDRSETDIQIVHAVPGRLRLRIPPIATDPDCADRLQKSIAAEERFTSIRLNPLTASIVITYEAEEMSDRERRSHLLELIHSALYDESETEWEPKAIAQPEKTDEETRSETPSTGTETQEAADEGTFPETSAVETDFEAALNYFNPCFVRALFNSLMARVMKPAQA